MIAKKKEKKRSHGKLKGNCLLKKLWKQVNIRSYKKKKHVIHTYYDYDTKKNISMYVYS